MFFGIFLVSIGEMLSSPRIQEYITLIAPKEKAGLYMGMNFLAIMIGAALSGVTYTALSGHFDSMRHADYVWYALAAHMVVGVAVLVLFTRTAGELKEREE